MNVVITGSRGLPPRTSQEGRRPLPEKVNAYVHEVIDNLAPGSVIRTGNAQGFDQIAKARAKERGLPVEDFDPEYDKYPGRVAPLKRNEEMADSDAEVCFAFAIQNSCQGTMHCARLFATKGKVVIVHDFDTEGNFLGFRTSFDLLGQ